MEDTRKVMQDFLAPELRAISARLDALEKLYASLEKKIEGVDQYAEKRTEALKDALGQRIGSAEQKIEDVAQRMDKRFDAIKIDIEHRLGEAERRAEQRHEMTMMAIGRLTDYNELRERMARLEAKQMTAA